MAPLSSCPGSYCCKMKTSILILLCACSLACYLPAAAQVRSLVSPGEPDNSSEEIAGKDDSYNWSAGAGAGITKLYAQLPESSLQTAFFAYFQKDVGQGCSYGVTVSNGGLESSYPFYNLGSYNQFTSADIHLSISLSALFTALSKEYGNYNNGVTRFTDNLYLGIGAGAINNDIKRIKPLDSGKITVIPESGKPVIKTQSVVPYLPFNAGYDLHVTKWIVLNANFQYTWCLGNYVDGYNMPFSGHRHTAVYTVGSLSVRYYITHTLTSKKVETD